MSVAAAVLCFGPMVATSLHEGLPSGLSFFELLVGVPIVTLLLGAPQIAMLVYVRAARLKALRVGYLAASMGMLGYFLYQLTAKGLSSSSTASIGLAFVTISMACATSVVGAALLWLDRRFPNSRRV